ncbi:hypothetical protein MJO29_013011 [Puccinia striiformis f. sp. tritici]|nr:hypothetical protein MJO29_013011 [Puccinia striiformis f. sp. tritici]
MRDTTNITVSRSQSIPIHSVSAQPINRTRLEEPMLSASDPTSVGRSPRVSPPDSNPAAKQAGWNRLAIQPIDLNLR